MNSHKMKIGIFSGTFDPVHVGHIEFALEAREICGLLGVMFLPERNPRQKTPISYEHRLAMLELAVKDKPWLSVRELNDEQFSIATTLPMLLKDFTDAELVFLMGSDLVKTFSYRWPGLQDMLSQVHLIVGLRKDDTEDDIKLLLNQTYSAYKLPAQYTLIKSPHVHLASTQIRTGNYTLSDISPEVANYIQTNNFYEDSSDLNA